MKFYKIYLYDNNLNYIKTLKFKSPIDTKDLDKYFLEYENLYCIEGCNKKGLMVYTLYKDKKFTLRIRNKENKKVCIKWYDGEIEYPYGEEKYNEYMREKKKEKLNKLLNLKEN